MNPLKGCDECLVGLNYLTCHEMNKICFDQNRNEINQEIMCLTEEEFNETPRDYPLNECLPSGLDTAIDTDRFTATCSAEALWNVSLHMFSIFKLNFLK